MQTALSKILILICVVMIAACGLKGPLYLPDESPVANPASPMESETDDEKKIENEEELEGSGPIDTSST